MKLKIVSIFLLIVRGAAFFAALLFLHLFINNTTGALSMFTNRDEYAKLKHHVGISISPYIDMSEEGMAKLDKTILAYFKATNQDGGWLFSLGNQLLMYNDGFIPEEEVLLTDYVVTVNSRYLALNPVYDTQGNVVVIPDDSEEYYLLIPEKFREKEEEIKRHFIEENTVLRYYTEDVERMGIVKASEEKHDLLPLTILYTKDNQRHFIQNSMFRGNLKNYVTDPLIRVVTANTVSAAQVPHYLTHQDYLVDVVNDPGLTKLNSILEETGLGEFVFHVNVPYETYEATIHNAGKAILMQLFLILFILLALVLAERKLPHIFGGGMRKYLLLSWILTMGMGYQYLNLSKPSVIIGVILLLLFDVITIFGAIPESPML